MAKVGKYLPGIACFFILGSKAQTSYTFTNAGSTGSLGPTQAMVNSAYASTSLSTAVTVSAGIQSWTVPTTGLYEIEAAGGSGGDYFSFKFGGLGAIMKGQFLLNSGDLLQILVGQRGTNSCTGSGGGGSYVLKNGSLILAAGGGGGCSTQQNGVSGTVSINGTMCSLNAVLGGSMGLGGQTCPVPGSGGAGGGFLAGSSGNGQGLFMTGGTSFLNGGIGGAAGPTSTMYIVAPGGFGGGGGVQQCALGGGGGGGYSGGAGGQEANTCVNGVKAGGGGGGSLNTGLNQVNTSGVNSGHGRVTLTYLCNAISLVSSSNPICIGNTATLSTNAISSYTWSNNSNSAFIVVSPSVTTSYTIQGLSSSNCMSYSVITLSVTSQPSVTVSPFNPSVCANSTLVLNANTNGGTAPYTYSWTGGPQNPAYSVSYTTGIANETIVVTDANNCVSSGTVSITVAANPTLNAPNNSICPGGSASLSVSGANSYTWLPSAVTGNSLVVSPTASVVYTVLGMAINGCTSSINSTLSVLQVPLLNLISQSITCASLGSAIVMTSGGIGPFTYTWLPGLQTSSVVNGLNPNTYSIIVHDLGTGCSTSTVQVFNSLIPLSGILANSQSITCPGASSGTAAVLNISGGSASQNYLWTNGTMSTSVSSPTNLSAGQWTVTVTDALTACQINSVFTILQPPANTLVISASSASICAGGVASFTATNNGGTPFTAGPAYTYSWSSGSTGSVYSSTPSIAGSLIHTVWSIDANSCAATQSILLTVVPLPTLSLNSVSICPLQVATLTATGASSYTWYPGLITGNSFTQSPASTQQFTVVGSAFSCNASATASIVLKTSPSPSITTNAPLCNGQTLSLTASGGSVYQWSGVLGFVSGSSAVLIPSVNPIQSGVYTVTVTGVNSCTASASINVTVHPNPTLTAIGSTVCSTQSMSLMAFSVPGATYLWNGPNGYSSAFQGTVVASPAASLSGVYQVTANSLQNCSSTATALVNITAAPAISITASNPKCLGGTLHLSGFGGTNYIWQGPNGFYSTLQNPSLSALSFSNTGTWSLTAITGPCTLTTALNIQVNPLPQPYASYNTPLCELNNLMLSVSPAQSYTWSGPQGFSSNSQNPTLSSVSFSNAGQYSVNVTDVNGCTGDTLVNVNVLSNPIPIATGATVCLGGNVNLSASGGVSYLWNGPNSFLSSNQNIFLQGVTAGQTGNYTVLITASNSCSSYTTVNLLGFNYSLPNPVIV
ncbi:MAG TPA: hypothetical protein PLQ93_08690, partial [Bacteroidia bacterium]|nr:hypothetical protein [Bacteroidia bacterium]